MGIFLKELRHAIVAGLRGTEAEPRIPAVGKRVFGQRSAQIQKGECPAILVYTNRENSEVKVDRPLQYRRVVEVVIDVVAFTDARHSGLEADLIDEIGQCLEDFMATFEHPGLFRVRMQSLSCGQEPDAQNSVSVGQWTYRVEYLESAPPSA